MSKASIEDITTRKPVMPQHARNYVDPLKDEHTLKPKRETVSLEEALKAEMLVNQALIDLLIAKGVTCLHCPSTLQQLSANLKGGKQMEEQRILNWLARNKE